MMKSWKSYFSANFLSAFRNLVACNLKISCSFIFWRMLHLKQRLAEFNCSLKIFQNWSILKLFQIDPKRKNLRSKVEQISERVLRTIIFWWQMHCRVRWWGIAISAPLWTPCRIDAVTRASVHWRIDASGNSMHRCSNRGKRQLRMNRIIAARRNWNSGKNEIFVIMKNWKSYFFLISEIS